MAAIDKCDAASCAGGVKGGEAAERSEETLATDGVLANLPEALRPLIESAFITGWRIPSEVLTLQWRQVDFKAGEVRLDPATTKNRDGRVFPMTDELRALLQARFVERQRLRLAGQLVPWVFFRMTASKRGGPEEPRQIRAFTKAWAAAAVAPAAQVASRTTSDERRCET